MNRPRVLVDRRLPALAQCDAQEGVRYGQLIQSDQLNATWRDARVAESDGLENRCGLTPTVGSNPTPSAQEPSADRLGGSPGASVVSSYRPRCCRRGGLRQQVSPEAR